MPSTKRARPTSYLNDIPAGAPDAILGIAANFKACPNPDKISLVVGAYRCNEGKPWVLPSVREAEKRLLARGADKEYAPICGVPQFKDAALRFAYGDDCQQLKDSCIAGVQALSGTGACRVAGEFYARFLPKGTAAYISDPTWGNHHAIMRLSGLEPRTYRYLDRKRNALDFAGYMEDIQNAPDGSVFVVHACAHNPTGIDPTREQWSAISDALLAKGHHVLMDCAYQGFASGDAEADAYAIRKFLDDGHSLLVAQSFAKNFGLYGERTGMLSVVCADKPMAERVLSQLKLIARPMYSNPPVHGALIVSEVLNDATLRAQYYKECKGMADRINEMRARLKAELTAAGSKHDWSHVTSQIGMFAFTGMSAAQVDELADKHAIFLTRDGRISVAGLNTKNVAKVAAAIHTVTEGKALGS